VVSGGGMASPERVLRDPKPLRNPRVSSVRYQMKAVFRWTQNRESSQTVFKHEYENRYQE